VVPAGGLGQADTDSEAKVCGLETDLAALVFNGPLTVDFRVDRDLAYEPVTATWAAAMISSGQVRRLDESGLDDLLALVRAEFAPAGPRSLGVGEFLDAWVDWPAALLAGRDRSLGGELANGEAMRRLAGRGWGRRRCFVGHRGRPPLRPGPPGRCVRRLLERNRNRPWWPV
jgi:hypothetical protein